MVHVSVSKRGARAAVAVLLSAVALASCGGDGAGGAEATGTASAVTAAPSSTLPTSGGGDATMTPPAPTTTSTPATSSATTIAAPTTTSPGEEPALLVADDGGIRVVDGEDVVATFLIGSPVAAALPDHEGGVVYQLPEAGTWRWAWDEAAGRAVLVVDDGPGPSSIYRIAAPGEPPEMVVSATDARPLLQQVVRLDGHPTLVYRQWAPIEGVACDEADPRNCLWMAVAESLHLLDLATGADVALGIIGEFESSWMSYVLGEDLMVVLSSAYGEPADACGRLAARSELLAAAGPSVWIGVGGPVPRGCEFPIPAAGCDGYCVEQIRAAMSRDETSVAFGVSSLPDDAAVLSIVDASSLEELRRVVVGDRWTADAWVDWDGEHAVVGGWLESGPVVLLADGQVRQLPAGAWAVLWKEES